MSLAFFAFFACMRFGLRLLTDLWSSPSWYILSTQINPQQQKMKFLQVLAGLTLLLPFATVLSDTVTEWGIDMTPPDVESDKGPIPDYPPHVPDGTRLRRRRLSESSVSQRNAEKACEHWGDAKDDCIFDVLTTGDLEMAMEGPY
jgi:hypothetical protein